MEELEVGSDRMVKGQEVHPFLLNDSKRKSVGDDDDQQVPDLEKVDQCGKDAAVSLSKKKRKEEAEAMDAETQRLLRESKKVAFPEGELQQKPISTVLEKMRQRKLERAQKGRSAQQGIGCSSRRPILDMKMAFSGDSCLNVDLDDDIELVMVKPPTQQVIAVKQEPISKFLSLQNIATWVGSVEETTRPSTPETRNESCRADEPSVIASKGENPARSLIESQDLYSDSQLSPIRDEAPDTRGAVGTIPLPELDSETQTEDYSSPEEDEEKENKDPARGLEALPTVSLVRGLIDDEAEDEDEDLLEDEVEEDDDAGKDLRDMLTQDVTEKPADKKRRADLHRKWLEQQDMSITDSILNRIENGWKNPFKNRRLPGILDEVEANDSRVNSSEASHEAVDEPAEPRAPAATSVENINEKSKDPGLRRERSLELEGVKEEENTEEFDDEEEDEQFRRQRLLSESEEQSELPSVHDDETSRQIFSLINKVNVVTVKATKVTTGMNDIRPLAMVHHQSISHGQSSFVRRSVTTSVQATTRQGSGNSRSYIFGRDDSNSNSNHSSRFQRNDSKSGKDSSPTTAAEDDQRSTRINSLPRGKVNKEGAVETTGPSLFQILKQQAADLERSVLSRDTSFSLNGSSSRSGDLSIFSVMKPSKQSRKSRV